MHYSVQTWDRIFVKCYRFLSFAKNIGKNIDKNISKEISKITIQKTADAAGDLIDSKIVNIIQKSQILYNRIIQKQLQIGKIKIYL